MFFLLNFGHILNTIKFGTYLLSLAHKHSYLHTLRHSNVYSNQIAIYFTYSVCECSLGDNESIYMFHFLSNGKHANFKDVNRVNISVYVKRNCMIKREKEKV